MRNHHADSRGKRCAPVERRAVAADNGAERFEQRVARLASALRPLPRAIAPAQRRARCGRSTDCASICEIGFAHSPADGDSAPARIETLCICPRPRAVVHAVCSRFQPSCVPARRAPRSSTMSCSPRPGNFSVISRNARPAALPGGSSVRGLASKSQRPQRRGRAKAVQRQQQRAARESKPGAVRAPPRPTKLLAARPQRSRGARPDVSRRSRRRTPSS